MRRKKVNINSVARAAERMAIRIIPTAAAIRIIIPAVSRMRGYSAFGGEWVLILAVYLISSAIASSLKSTKDCKLEVKEVRYEYSHYDVPDRDRIEDTVRYKAS